jgi:hypothetical protein
MVERDGRRVASVLWRWVMASGNNDGAKADTRRWRIVVGSITIGTSGELKWAILAKFWNGL